MPYKRHAPCPISEMETSTFQGENAVFQVLRDIYHMTEDENIKMKCRIGISMAQAMMKRLVRYEYRFFGSRQS